MQPGGQEPDRETTSRRRRALHSEGLKTRRDGRAAEGGGLLIEPDAFSAIVHNHSWSFENVVATGFLRSESRTCRTGANVGEPPRTDADVT